METGLDIFKNYKRTCWEFYQFCSTGKYFQFFMSDSGDSAIKGTDGSLYNPPFSGYFLTKNSNT
jgi:hypothetical protein